MYLEKLQTPLKTNEIDFRIQSINNGKYATILAYKDARVDMNRLDNVVGAGYWKREHFDNNTKCRVSIYNINIKEWVYKEDIGTESQTEKQKGLASDSFKRACFNWGIGRELYDYPVIKVKLNDNEVLPTGKDKPKFKASYNLDLKKWKWTTVFEDSTLTYLQAVDSNGIERFLYDTSKKNIKEKTYKDCKTKEELRSYYSSLDKNKQAAMKDLITEFSLTLK